jgi:flagellar biosynthesis GTPase FlhF
MRDKTLSRAELAQGRLRTRKAGGGRRGSRRRDAAREAEPVAVAPGWVGRRPFTMEALPDGMTLRDVLAWHVLPAPLAAVLAEGDLPTALGRLLTFAPLALEKATPLAFCGPSGGGQTLALARMAVSHVLRERHVDAAPLVIACDAVPEGAARLTAWLKPYGVPVFRAATAEAVRAVMSRKGAAQPVLLDLPEGSVYASGGLTPIREVIEQTGSSPVVVVPAGMDAEEAADTAAAYRQIGAERMIATKLDQAGRIGSVITAAACGLALTYAGYSPSVRGGAARCDAGLLARRLMVVPT